MKHLVTLTALLEHQARVYKNKNIFNYLDTNGNVSFSQSFNQIADIAKGNASQLIKKYPEQPAAVLLYPSGPEFILAYFTCLYAGKIAIPLTYKKGFEKDEIFLNQITLIQKEVQSTLIIVDNTLLNEIPDIFRKDCIVFNIDKTIKKNKINSEVNATACYLFTSGSTSQPKGVVLSHKNLIDNSHAFTSTYCYNEKTVTVSWLPHFHAFGMLLNFYYPLISGTPVYIMPTTEFINNPLSWLANASTYRATHLAAPDFGFRLCAQEIENGNIEKWNLSHIEYAFSSSEPVRIESFDRFFQALKPYGLRKKTLSAMYGMSEASVITAQNKRKLISKSVHRDDLDNGLVKFVSTKSKRSRVIVSCGQSIPTSDVVVVDPQTAIQCNQSEVGEVWVKGPSVFDGYLNPDDNEGCWERIKGKKGKYFRTGDAGFINGTDLYITGRFKEMIIANGKNYYPIDIEHTVSNNVELLRDTRKAAFSNETGQEEFVTIVLEYPITPYQSELKLIGHKVVELIMRKNGLRISRVVFVANNEIPRTVTGKIQRRKCRSLLNNKQLKILYTYSLDEAIIDQNRKFPDSSSLIIEQKLYQILEEVLKKAIPFSSSNSFYSLGAGSIELMRIASRIRQTFKLDIQISELLVNSNLEKLVEFIHEKQKATDQLLSSSKHEAFNETQHFPLTITQRGILFELLNDPTNYQYNTPLAFQLVKEVDIQRLFYAFDQLQKKFPILRIRIFESANEGTFMKIAKRAVPLKILKTAVDELSLYRLIERETNKPIIPSPSSALFIGNVYVTLKQTVLVINASHLITDGLSCQLIIDNLIAFYEDRNNKTVESEIFVLDKIEKEAIQELHEKVEGFLSKRKSKLFKKLPLPYNSKGNAMTPRWNHFFHDIQSSLQKEIENCVQEIKTTKFSFFLAVFAITLYRLTREKDITIGSAFLNRSERTIENSLGYFANLLPVLVTLTENESFTIVAQKILNEVTTLFEIQNFPLPELLHRIRKADKNTEEPVFQAILLFQTWKDYKKEENSLIEEQLFHVVQPSIADFTIDILDLESRSIMYIKYDNLKIDPSIANIIFHNFIDVLQQVLENPSKDVHILQEPSYSDKNLLDQLNQSATSFPSISNIFEYFINSALVYSGKTAIHSKNNIFSYKEVLEKVDLISCYLKQNGLKNNEVVVVHIERNEWLPIVILSLLKIGVSYIPLDPSLPRERLQYITEHAQVHAVIQFSHCSLTLETTSIKEIYLDKLPNATLNASREIETYQYDPKDTVFLIYTSGSTGKPKGVIINHQALVNFYCSIIKEPGISHQDHLLAVSTVSFDIAFTELIVPLLVGATITIASEEEQRNGEALLEKLENHSISILQGTPVTWNLLFHAGWASNSPLTKAISTGEALPPSLAKKILDNNVQLWNLYGPSEATIETTIAEITEADHVPIGRPLPNVQLFILDDKLKQVPVGAFGELYIAGNNLATGYYGSSKLTNERFLPIAKDFGSIYTTMYKTGDIVRLGENNMIFYCGRNDHQVKIRGYRVELQEIENVIREYPSVQDACVVVEEASYGPTLKACIVPTNSNIKKLEVKLLVNYLKGVLPDYMIPNYFYVRENLPVLANGKVDRKVLFEQGSELLEKEKSRQWKNSSKDTYAATSVVKRVEDAWEKVLAKKVSSTSINFFDAGGDSIKILHLKRHLEEVFPTNIVKQTDLFKYTTIATQTDWLSSQNSVEALENHKKVAYIIQEMPKHGYQALFEE